jgi:hypothetical protein
MLGFSGLYLVAIGGAGGMIPSHAYPSLSRLSSGGGVSGGTLIEQNVILDDDDDPITDDDDIAITADGGS